MIVPAFVLVFGLFFGAIMVGVGVANDDDATFLGGAAELLFVPILCAARFIMVRLYGIIQALAASDDETASHQEPNR